MKNSLISKIVSVGTALQIGMFGGLNACAGNSLSLHTTTKEPATKAVKLEPDLLACVFVNMPFHYDEIW